MANSSTVPRDSFLHSIRNSQNRINHPIGGALVSFDFFQGDLLWFDSSVGYVKPLDSDAHAAYLAGVAIRNAYVAPYASMVQAGGPALVKNFFPTALLGLGDVYTFFSTAAEVYSHGQAMFFGTDAQTLTKTDPGAGHSVGTVYTPQGGTIAGGSTVLVPVLVVAQIPIQSL